MKFTGLRGTDGVLGGDLVDTATPFAARDKVAHVVLGGYAYLLADRWTGLPVLWCLAMVLGLAIVNEAVEDVRYRRYRWTASLSDEADGTDVLVSLAGGVAAWLIM